MEATNSFGHKIKSSRNLCSWYHMLRVKRVTSFYQNHTQ